METNPSESENQPKEQTPAEEPKVQEIPEGGITETTLVDDSQEETKDKQSSEEQKKMVLDLMEKVQAMGGDPKNPKNQAALKEFQKYKTLYEKHDFWDTQPVPKVAGKRLEKRMIS